MFLEIFKKFTIKYLRDGECNSDVNCTHLSHDRLWMKVLQ